MKESKGAVEKMIKKKDEDESTEKAKEMGEKAVKKIE